MHARRAVFRSVENAMRFACAVLLLGACGRKGAAVEVGDSASQDLGVVTADGAAASSIAVASDASESSPDTASDASPPSAEEIASAIREHGELALITNGDDTDDVQRTIRAHMKDVRGCYSNELKAHPKLTGKVVMHFTITTEGTTRDVTSTRTGLDPAVAACMEKVVRSLQFPASPAPRKVSFPFIFQQAG